MNLLNAVNLRYAVFTCVLFASLPSNADINAETDAIIDHVFVKVVDAIGSYGERIAHCDEVVAGSTSPKLDKVKLGAWGAKREDMVLAITYFSFKNYAFCEHDERLALAYHSGTLASLVKDLQLDPKHIEKLEAQLFVTSTLENIVAFPSATRVSVEIQYGKLPKQQRDYYESVLGRGGPYRLIETVKSNGLSRD